jgi:hypothetical protein
MVDDRRSEIKIVFSTKDGDETIIDFKGDARDFKDALGDVAAASGGDIRPVPLVALPYLNTFQPSSQHQLSPAPPQNLLPPVPITIEDIPPQTQYYLPDVSVKSQRSRIKFYFNLGMSAILTSITIGVFVLFARSEVLRKNLMNAITISPPSISQPKITPTKKK